MMSAQLMLIALFLTRGMTLLGSGIVLTRDMLPTQATLMEVLLYYNSLVAALSFQL